MMSINKLIMCLLVAVSAAWSSQAKSFSQDFYASTCNNCNYSQLADSAIYQGMGNRYVADFALGILYKFDVSRETDFNGFMYFADSVSVETDHTDAFNRAKAIWDANGHSLNYAKQVSASTALSDLTAFDAVDPGIGRNTVINYVSNWNNWGLLDTIAAEYQAYASGYLGFRTGQSIVITITVDFSDGSHMDLQFNFSNNTWTYVDKSAVDSHDNPVPQSTSDIVRTQGGTQAYNYSGPGNPTDLQSALDRFAALGVPIVTGGGGGWACTSGGGVTICERFN